MRYPPRATNWDFLADNEVEEDEPNCDWSFFLDEPKAEGDGEDDVVFFAVGPCSDVPYFLGLPLFLFTVSKGDGETAAGALPAMD